MCNLAKSSLTQLASVFPSLQWSNQRGYEHQGDARAPGKKVVPALLEPTCDDVAPQLQSPHGSPVSTQTRNNPYSQHTRIPNSMGARGPLPCLPSPQPTFLTGPQTLQPNPATRAPEPFSCSSSPHPSIGPCHGCPSSDPCPVLQGSDFLCSATDYHRGRNAVG